MSIMYRQDRRISTLPVERYPDGMPLIHDRSAVEAVLVRPPTFHAALWWVDSMRYRGLPAPHLILPLVPGSRQDRLNDTGDALFTLKSVAEAINARGFPSVTVLDPHSDVTPALIDRCIVAPLPEMPPIYDGVICPDAGARKRAEKVAAQLGCPVYQAWKTRDLATGKLSGFGCEPLPPRPATFLVVDDLCDGGGTFVGLAALLKAEYPEAVLDLYVTHGLFTQGTERLLEQYRTIYTTDSVVPTVDRDRDRIIILPVAIRLLSGQDPLSPDP